jgi:hypothetical protein
LLGSSAAGLLNAKSKVNKKSKQMEAAILGSYDATVAQLMGQFTLCSYALRI